jgi:beta-galactosidase/beta-glucuronidase
MSRGVSDRNACGHSAGAPPDGGANCTFPEALTNLTAEQIDLNRNWTFQINGRRVFARGANWLPCDMRISECTAADYDYLLGTAADANMNFVRVWGGGGIEKEAFFDAADRLGIMVYHETMHSQSLPTRDVNFANERHEVVDMINKLSSHPSVVRYGWGNEYYGVNHSSNRFERQYEDTTNALDGTRRATHGSPVTWADRHGPYCFYLSTVGAGQA